MTVQPLPPGSTRPATPPTQRGHFERPESYEPFGHAWQLDDVMALAISANEAAGVPDPEPCPGCDGSGTFPTPGPGGWLVGPCLVCSEPTAKS